MKNAAFALIALLSFSLNACRKSTGPDLIIYNARIYTVDSAFSVVEAIAIKDGRIEATGTSKEIAALAGRGTQKIDLRGKTVIPGFIEGHGHFLGMGRNKLILDLSVARSWEEIVQQVETASREVKPGTWILGRGWHQEKWEVKPERLAEGYPTNYDLSRRVPEHPVLLTHVSGHADIVNQRAMMLAGINETTPDPENGQIIREANGKPAGVFLGAARQPLNAALNAWRKTLSAKQLQEDELKAAFFAAEECLQNGVTSFQDAGSTFADVKLLRQLAEQGKLPVRLYLMIREPLDTLKKYAAAARVVGAGNGHFTVRSFKLSLDGALGARSAWMLEPYTDLSLKSGIPYFPIAYFQEVAALALQFDYQMCTHAIGDRANRETLNVYEKVIAENPDADLRWRIEHAQHLHPSDIPRFGRSGIIPSIQAVHCTSDGPWVPVRIGQRRAENGAYRWRDLAATGARIVNGTDVPVESINPIANFAASVTRQMNNGERFYPEQAMTREEALRSMTINPAYAAFEEKEKGSLEPGKRADFVVLSADLMQIPEIILQTVYVEQTWVAGIQRFVKKQ